MHGGMCKRDEFKHCIILTSMPIQKSQNRSRQLALWHTKSTQFLRKTANWPLKTQKFFWPRGADGHRSSKISPAAHKHSFHPEQCFWFTFSERDCACAARARPCRVHRAGRAALTLARSAHARGLYCMKAGRLHCSLLPRKDPTSQAPRAPTSTVFNFYTGLKFMSKAHFYGRVAGRRILAITYENRSFYGRGAAEANFSV